MKRLRPVLAALLAACGTAAVAAAQTRWLESPLLGRRIGPVAFDGARDRLVLLAAPPALGVPETWEWDDSTWSRRSPSRTPPSGGGAMCLDAVRGVAVWFGGDPAAGTWEWDGNDWSLRTSAQAPPRRAGHAVAFDLLRGRTVLFGGVFTPLFGLPLHRSDTWEWDGANWTQVAVPAAPPGRTEHALAYDLASGRTVLFGGRDGGSSLGDTWTFDGAAWQRQNPASSPPPRTGHCMAGDPGRGRVVLFGGLAAGAAGDTWEWDGSTWLQAAPAAAPSPRWSAAMAHDPVRGRMLLWSGVDATGEVSGDLWHWTGANWSRRAGPAVPRPRHSAAAAFDLQRARVLLFGGLANGSLGDHWEWDGAAWTERTPAVRPPARGRAAMACDTVRGRVVLFGGEQPPALADTWEWDGVAWTQAAPAPAPAARYEHAMAFDPRRAVTVLFGGLGTGYLADTWEWNGQVWSQRSPAAAPQARYGHAMAFDPGRGVTLLFGGAAAPFGQPVGDTWEWDGIRWQQRTPATSPAPRVDHTLVHDGARGRAVLFGGGFAALGDTWEWDGADWTLRAVAAPPPPRHRHAAVHDPLRAVTVLSGGTNLGPGLDDTWEYGPLFAASAVPFGSACAGTAGVLELSVEPGQRPWLGDTVMLRLGPAPAPGFALLWLGLSAVSWQSLSLPLALGPFGLPGCTLDVAPDATSLAAVAAGSAAFLLAVPNDPVLLGVEVFAEGAAADAAANAFGAVVSGALALAVGGR